MFKRVENNRENEYSVPAKRPKYDMKKGTSSEVSANNTEFTNKKGKSDDIWGDDFAEEDIEEMDFVATQASLQVLFIYKQSYMLLVNKSFLKFNIFSITLIPIIFVIG